MTPFYLALTFSIPAEKSEDCHVYSKAWQRKSLQVYIPIEKHPAKPYA